MLLLTGLLAFAVACASTDVPAAPPTLTPVLPPPSVATPPETPSPEVRVNLEEVPPVDLTRHSVPLEDVVFDTFRGGFVRLSEAQPSLILRLRDALKPIYNPRYGDTDGLPWLEDYDLVIGYATDAGAYAYPIKVLNFRELVNDVIDGVPVLISYCPLCASGVVYSRELDGRTLLFGNTSALFESDLVMYDHETGSYWFQVMGEAVVGELTGARLPLLPSMTTTWGRWKLLYPETRLLVGDGPGERTLSARRYGNDPFADYADSLDSRNFAFPVSEERLDSRLPVGAVVLVVEANGAAKAYPLEFMGNAAVNDVIGGQRVVVLSQDHGITGAAYAATLGEQRLTFRLEDGAFKDAETGSTWSASGLAVDGPLEGSRLEALGTRRALWFSVAGAIPDLELYAP